MTGLTKYFSGVPALKGVDFTLTAGRVHALLGQNGAGKSTLISILSGVIQADSGTIELDSKVVSFPDPSAALGAGIVAVYQEFSLLPDMTVAENLFVGIEPSSHGVLNRNEMALRSKEILDRLGARDISPSSLVGLLPVASQQMVEIAKALTRDTRILILDEPSAVLGDDELELLYELIGRLTADGIAIVYITHRLDEVIRIADDVTVMRDGSMVFTALKTSITHDDMIEAMVGRKVLANVHPTWQSESAPPATEQNLALSVESLMLPGLVAPGISFEVQRGEILGIVGLTGSGRSRVLRVLAGLQHRISGDIRLGALPIRTRSPRHAIAQGIILVPEDRKRLGLVLDQSVASNMVLSILNRISTFGWIAGGPVQQTAKDLMSRLDVKATGPNQIVRFLSGGNQQKVAIARCLATNPALLLLDEPLRGVDVGAKSEILDIIGEIAAQGTAVIVVSSEVEDVLALTDRVLVMRDGAVAAELSGSQTTEASILRASVGASQ